MDTEDKIPDEIEGVEPLEHVGYKSQRVVWALSPMESLERIFAFRWMEVNKEEWCVLDRLVCTNENRLGATQRDAEVAATVVQWLGTAVGYSFLSRCLKEAGFKIQPPEQ